MFGIVLHSSPMEEAVKNFPDVVQDQIKTVREVGGMISKWRTVKFIRDAANVPEEFKMVPSSEFWRHFGILSFQQQGHHGIESCLQLAKTVLTEAWEQERLLLQTAGFSVTDVHNLELLRQGLVWAELFGIVPVATFRSDNKIRYRYELPPCPDDGTMSEIRLVMEQMGPDSGGPPINASFTQVIPAKRSGEEVTPRSFAIVHTDDRDIIKGFLLQVIQIRGLGVNHTDLGTSIYARTFFQRALAAGNGEIIYFQPLHGDD